MRNTAFPRLVLVAFRVSLNFLFLFLLKLIDQFSTYFVISLGCGDVGDYRICIMILSTIYTSDCI
jgi:hypothetical protein